MATHNRRSSMEPRLSKGSAPGIERWHQANVIFQQAQQCLTRGEWLMRYANDGRCEIRARYATAGDYCVLTDGYSAAHRGWNHCTQDAWHAGRRQTASARRHSL